MRYLKFAYLWPFIFVRSWHVLPWIGEDRQAANDTNGALMLALLVWFAVMSVLLVVSPRVQSGPIDLYPAMALYLVLAIGHLSWLTRKRSSEVTNQFKALHVRDRAVCVAASIVFFGSLVAAFFTL